MINFIIFIFYTFLLYIYRRGERRMQPQKCSLHTEAQSIRDWESVCDHVIKRSNGITMENEELLQLFCALASTFGEYEQMADKMRQILTTQRDYIEVPDYQQTAIHRGCGLVQDCLERMHSAYTELHEYLNEVCQQITGKQQEWKQFVDEIVPFTQSVKEKYLTKEQQLHNAMTAYMQAAEVNDRCFFVVAREYQRTLLDFQKILKKSTDSMQDVIRRVQSVENEKKEFESRIQRHFIDSVLNQQALIKQTFGSSFFFFFCNDWPLTNPCATEIKLNSQSDKHVKGLSNDPVWNHTVFKQHCGICIKFQ